MDSILMSFDPWIVTMVRNLARTIVPHRKDARPRQDVRPRPCPRHDWPHLFRGGEVISRHVESVKRQKDDARDYADLTRPKQLNALADHRATVGLDRRRAVGKTTAFYPVPTCREAIFVTATAGISSVGKYARTLRTALLEYEVRVYLQRRNDWSSKTNNSICWSVYR
jgi:hypothetical protein